MRTAENLTLIIDVSQDYEHSKIGFWGVFLIFKISKWHFLIAIC